MKKIPQDEKILTKKIKSLVRKKLKLINQKKKKNLK